MHTKFWMIYNPVGRAPTVEHPDKAVAEREAKRLAQAHPGNSFFVLEAVSVSAAVNVVTTPL